MEQDDEEFEELLGEIPRATSAFHHSDGTQRRPSISPLQASSSVVTSDEAAKQISGVSSIGLPADVYQIFKGVEESQPLAENSGICLDASVVSIKSATEHLSSFYNGLTFETPSAKIRNGQGDLQSNAPLKQQQLSPQEQQATGASSLGENQALSPSQQQVFPENQTLSSTLLNLNIEEDITSNHGSHLSMENENGRICTVSVPTVGGLSFAFSEGSTNDISFGSVLRPRNVPLDSITRSSSYPLDLYPDNSRSSLRFASNLSHSMQSQASIMSSSQIFQKIMLGGLSADESSGNQTRDRCSNGKTLELFANGGALGNDGGPINTHAYYRDLNTHSNGGVLNVEGEGPNLYTNVGGLDVIVKSRDFNAYSRGGDFNAYSRGGDAGLALYWNGSGKDSNNHANEDGLDLQANRSSQVFDHPNPEASAQSIFQHYTATSSPSSVRGLHNLPVSSLFGTEVLSSPPLLRHQLPLDSQVASYYQVQQMQGMHVAWHRKEEERRRMLLQHSQALASLQSQARPVISDSSLSMERPTYYPSIFSGTEQFYRPHQPGGVNETEWNFYPSEGAPERINPNNPESSSQSGNYCRYFAQGFCVRGESCPFTHLQERKSVEYRASQLSGGSASLNDAKVASVLGHRGEKGGSFVPEKILSQRSSWWPVPSGSETGRRKKDSLASRHANGHASANGHQLPTCIFPGSLSVELQNTTGAVVERLETDLPKSANGLQHQQQLKYNSLEEVEGRIYFTAKDQHGCRFLQRKFDEGGPEEVQKIFLEIIDHIIELMTDPFGNYLIQKLLEVCNDKQRMEILRAVTEKEELVNISLNMHGTRAVQKLIETLKSPQQVSMIISSLRSGVVALIKDINGNHVVQRCLQRLGHEDSQFIFDAVASHCVEVATHRHGCCVLQRCVDYSVGAQQQCLVAEIAANALVLSQDPFGNYVVQYVLDLGMPWASEEVMDQLEQNYAFLSMQKFSSNVVEKCLKLAGEEHRNCIIRELINSPRLAQLLQDPYANYVIQSALTVSKGTLHTSLVEAIRPHSPGLRSSPYGKRILSRTNLKK